MKTGSRKIMRGFKLEPKLTELLRREAAKQRRTQTAVVEMALEAWFAQKSNAQAA